MRSARLALALALAAIGVGCAATPEPVPPAIPSLIGANFAMPPYYRIEGRGGATLLLMGTIHLGPTSGWAFSPALLDGIDLADRFILEIDLREATEEAVSDLLATVVVIEPPDTLPTLVSPETAKLLAEMDPQLAALGMPVNARLRLKPWFISMGLIEYAAQRSGYAGTEAAENAILERVGGRPLMGLESFREQIEMLDGLSRKDQDFMLRDTLLRLDTAVDEIHALVGAWRRGDEAELSALARAGLDALPELEGFYAAILDERNARWMSTFRSLLDDPEHAGELVFVGVGALHVVGEQGLVDLFREAGYAVARIDPFAEIQPADH